MPNFTGGEKRNDYIVSFGLTATISAHLASFLSDDFLRILKTYKHRKVGEVIENYYSTQICCGCLSFGIYLNNL